MDISKLVEPWIILLNGDETDGKFIPQTFPPMIEILQKLVIPDTGRHGGRGGLAHERSPIDLKSFTLLEHVEDIVYSGCHVFKVEHEGGLIPALVALAEKVQTLWDSNVIPEMTYQYYVNKFRQWEDQIWNLYDPPRVREVLAACPICGESDYFNMEGEKSTAVIIQYAPNDEPEALCRRCNQVWVGVHELRNLGFRIGAVADEDTLREMGIA